METYNDTDFGYYQLDQDKIPVKILGVPKRRMPIAERRVAKTKVGESEVSTVFLELNHGYDNGPPILWETLVFGGSLDGECERYRSNDDAIAGHLRMVQRVQDSLSTCSQ